LEFVLSEIFTPLDGLVIEPHGELSSPNSGQVNLALAAPAPSQATAASAAPADAPVSVAGTGPDASLRALMEEVRLYQRLVAASLAGSSGYVRDLTPEIWGSPSGQWPPSLNGTPATVSTGPGPLTLTAGVRPQPTSAPSPLAPADAAGPSALSTQSAAGAPQGTAPSSQGAVSGDALPGGIRPQEAAGTEQTQLAIAATRLTGSGQRTGATMSSATAGTLPPYRFLVSDGEALYFRVLPLQDMLPDLRLGVLRSRTAYKKLLFATSIAQLERDPGIPDLPPCAAGQAPSGQCLLTAAAVQAQSAQEAAESESSGGPRIQRRVALMIGLNRYDDKRIPQLFNAQPDATAVGETLAGQLGYEIVRLDNPTKAQMVQALNTLALEVKPTDSLLLFFAGHGEMLQQTGFGYWIPRDARADDPRTWLSNSDINKVLGVARSRQIAVLSDSCYSGAFNREAQLDAQSASRRIDDYLGRRAVTIMTSGGDEPVSDGGKNGHSPFAWNLMQQVRGLTDWQPGLRLFTEVRTAVQRDLPQIPEYGASLSAGHERGADFLFEPRRPRP
jgi:hypothetical protein